MAVSRKVTSVEEKQTEVVETITRPGPTSILELAPPLNPQVDGVDDTLAEAVG